MSHPPRPSWLSATQPARRTLAESLPRERGLHAVETTSAWLVRTPAPVAATATATATAEARPAPCPTCAELTALKAELAARTARADEAGRAEGLQATAALRDRLGAAVGALEQAYAAQTRTTVDAIVDVALAVCAELAPAAARLDTSALAGLLAQVVGLTDAKPATLRLHPDDAAALAADVPATIKIEPDPTLAPGEVRAAGARQVIDATWATRLAALREPLVGLVRASTEAAITEAATAAAAIPAAPPIEVVDDDAADAPPPIEVTDAPPPVAVTDDAPPEAAP